MRLWIVAGIALVATIVDWSGPASVAVAPVVATCGGLAAVSTGVLLASGIAPELLLCVQLVADFLGTTLLLGLAVGPSVAEFLWPAYAVVIVPASLVSLPGGLAGVTAATVANWLLGAAQGFAPASIVSVRAVAPPVLYLLLARVCFIYAAHLRESRTGLASVAARLDDNRRRLVEQTRMSAALLDVARMLGSTLEPQEVLARLISTTRRELGADWCATFLVDGERATFRPVAVTDAETLPENLARLEFPVQGWSWVERLRAEPVVVLTGADAERTPGLFTSGRRLSTMVLAGLRHDGRLLGFLAIGFGTLPDAERERTAAFVVGVAQQAAIVLRNAHLVEEVRLASALKSEFVGAISHELRSPINVMLGYLEMLLDEGLGPISPDQSDALARTRAQTLSLHEMIAALLDLNRLEAGRLPLQLTEISLRDFLEELREQLPENWRRPEVELRLAVVPNLPSIETDPGKLKTVIRNLLHNAFKFTERGQVIVGAGHAPNGDLVITVTDTGRGMPPDALKYIFEMFRQVPGAGGGGVGLGLHLVRRLVTVLGGTISVKSQLDQGTCFTITLPPAAVRGRPAPVARRDAAASTARVRAA
jgi:signal transduction histidine kinase